MVTIKSQNNSVGSYKTIHETHNSPICFMMTSAPTYVVKQSTTVLWCVHLSSVMILIYTAVPYYILKRNNFFRFECIRPHTHNFTYNIILITYRLESYVLCYRRILPSSVLIFEDEHTVCLG